MEKSEITITYETIFELLLREKSREDLQKLSPVFLKDVISYLNEKKQIMKVERRDVFSAEEREKTRKQLVNLQKMLTELYERREKKIITLALIRSRIPAAIIDTSSMLEEEKQLFEVLIEILDSFRKNVLHNVIEGEFPVMPLFSQKTNIPIPKEKETKLIRFISAVPKFVGKELEIYGPFDEEDVANLPFEIADILIRKGKAEEVIE